MANVINVKPGDEVTDLVETLRGDDAHAVVGLVVPPNARLAQSAVNMKLLRQYGDQMGKQISIISVDRRTVAAADTAGLVTYPSVDEFHEAVGQLNAVTSAPRHISTPARSSKRLSAARGGSGAVVAPLAMAAAAEAAGITASSATAASVEAAAAAGATTSTARPTPIASHTTELPLDRSEPKGPSRVPLYGGGVAVLLVGVVLFLLLASTATVTVTIVATPLTVNPIIQGTTTASQASASDFVLTKVATSTQTNAFTATPTGTKTIPAVAASGTLELETNVPGQTQMTVPQGSQFTAEGATPVVFTVTTSTTVTLTGPTPQDPSGSFGSPSATPIPVTAVTTGTNGNLTQGTNFGWTNGLCGQTGGTNTNNGNGTNTGNSPTVSPSGPSTPSGCQGVSSSNFQAVNPSSMAGGVNTSQVTIVSAADETHFQTQEQQAVTTLTTQINSDIQNQATGMAVATDPGGGGGVHVTTTVSPQLPAPGQQVSATTITVSATGQATLYNASAVRQDVVSDLEAAVPAGDMLVPNPTITTPSITSASSNGTILFSGAGSGYAQPKASLGGLRTQLTGRTSGQVSTAVDGRLGPLVRSVSVSQWPLSLPFLPLSSGRIQIVEKVIASNQN